MATYRIVNRRKKGARASEILPETARPAVSAAEQVAPPSAEAAYQLYEEFFGSEGISPSPAKGPETGASDLIAPESMEPTREFEVAELLKESGEENADPSEQESEEISGSPEVSEVFSSLFGEEKKQRRPFFGKKKTPGEAAPAGAVSAPVSAPIPPSIPGAGALAGDTIRFDPLSPEADEDVRLYEPAGRGETRVDINDLVHQTIAAGENAEETPAETTDENEHEFHHRAQADGLFVELKKKIRSLWVRLALLLALFAGALYLESACFETTLSLPRPEFLVPGRFGPVFLLAELQLIVLAAAAAWRQVKEGFAGLFTGRGAPQSVASVALFVSVFHLGVLLGLFATSTAYVLFGSVAIFLCALTVLRDILSTCSDLRALRLLAEDKPLFAAVRAGENSPELAAFSAHLGEEIPEVYSISRTEFADGFVRRTEKREGGGAVFTVGIPLLLLLSAGVAVWCYLGGSQNVIHAVGAFVCSMMMGLPACSVFSVTLPFFFASRRAESIGCALLGESAVEEATEAEIISFDDTEVFLPKHVKVSSVKTYGAARIDKILIYCAQIFRVVGGPLSYVFENSISSLSVPGHVDILENEGDGICARIDGKEIFLGSSAYMEAYEFPVEIDESDAEFESSVGRIMYLAADGELAAKFYIRYAVSARFAAQLADLNRAGIYVAVKTCDPNVDADLIQKILHKPDYPIGVIKTAAAAKNAPAEAHLDAPIAANTKISAVLSGFLLCDGVRQRSALATLIKFVSMLLGLFISFVLTGMQSAYLTPTVCLLYQLIWLVPVVVPATFDWKSPKHLRKKH